MPCILKVRITSARDLPIMDRATEAADAFVEVKFADFEPKRTQIAKRTLNPIWNEDFRFDVSDDSDLQNEPLEIKILDHDTITYNDVIGTVFVDLNSLLSWDSCSEIKGWFPIFDTLRGIRGELNAQVKLQYFGDINPFKDSSTSVQFFSINSIPSTYQAVSLLGFVSALDSADDPEYHWSDNFRTPRTSNEARTRLMYQLSGQLRRQLGKRVLEMGGNAVVGYKQFFDLESEEHMIIARAIGTAVKLGIDNSIELNTSTLSQKWNLMQSPVLSPTALHTLESTFPPITSPLFTPFKTDNDQAGNASPTDQQHISTLDLDIAGRIEKPIQILTLDTFASACILGSGGFVSAVSVKLIENDDKELRITWWNELRDEIKSHAKQLNCNYILGYTETITIEDELCVLQCSGTATVCDMSLFEAETTSRKLSTGNKSHFYGTESKKNSKDDFDVNPPNAMESDVEKNIEEDKDEDYNVRKSVFSSSKDYQLVEKKKKKKRRSTGCQFCHITYRRQDSPFPMAFFKCNFCKKKHVPEILLSSIQPPDYLETIEKGCLIEAHVCRPKKIKVGDVNATIVSEAIPFIQYDIHSQLTHKLRINGLNAVFGLKIQISVGENMITGVATGTSIFVKALPLPPSLKVLRNIDVVDEEDVKLLEVQKKIQIQSEQNRMKIESALNEKDIIENVEALFVSKKDTEAGSESIMQQNSDEVAPSRSDFPKKKSTTVGQSSQIDGVEAITDVLSEDGSSGESSSESEFDELMKSASNSLRHRLVVVQIDDEQDEDLVLLLDPTFPVGFQLLNLEPTANLIFNSEEQKKTGSQQNFTERSQSKLQLITLVKQGLIHLQHHPNRQLAEIFKTMYKEIQLQLSYFSPCIVAGIEYSIKLPQENEVQITMIAACIGQSLPLNDLEPEYQEDDSVNLFKLENLTDRSGYDSPKSSKHGSASLNESFKFRFSKFQAKPSALNVSKVPTPIDEKFKSPSVSEEDFNPIQENDEEYNSKSLNVSSRFHTSQSEGIDLENGNSRSNISNPRENTVTDTGVRNSNMPNNNIPFVELTPLKSVQNRRILKFLGRLSLHFVKEANIVFETGLGLSGMGGFTHEFWCEVYSVLRAHTAAQGGNCLIGLTIDQNIFSESIKNQGYALLSCSGDVVFCDPDSAYETFEEEDMGKGFGEKLFGEVIDFNILGGNNIESSQWLKASRIGLDFFGRLSETTSTRNSALSLN